MTNHAPPAIAAPPLDSLEARPRVRLPAALSATASWVWSRVRSLTRPAPAPAPQADLTCLFCQQTDPEANRIPVSNRTCFVRFDNFPAARGHIEVVPKRHVVSFFELTEDEVVDAYSLLRMMHRTLVEQFGPDGFTIGVNEGHAAGRTVDHLHIHLIPRRFGDVDDPRGGIRQVLPTVDPSTWAALSY